MLVFGRDLPAGAVEMAVRGALAAGAHDDPAVASLGRRREREDAPALQAEERMAGIGALPSQDLSGHDQMGKAGR